MWADDNRCVYTPCAYTAETDSSDEEDISELQPDGYVDGVLPEYIKNCYKNGGTKVDCSKAIKVYIDVNPHELKKVDDQNEEFNMIFVLKLAWLDPDLRNFETEVTLRNEGAGKESKERHLDRKRILLTRKCANGDIQFVDLDDATQRMQTFSKSEYVSMKDPVWEDYFFPDFSFLNMQNEGVRTLERRTLLWCGDMGGFVSYSMKYYATFQESLELHSFPLDRQLCRTGRGYLVGCSRVAMALAEVVHDRTHVLNLISEASWCLSCQPGVKESLTYPDFNSFYITPTSIPPHKKNIVFAWAKGISNIPEDIPTRSGYGSQPKRPLTSSSYLSSKLSKVGSKVRSLVSWFDYLPRHASPLCFGVWHLRFVPLVGSKKIAQVCDMWGCDDDMQKKCTVYVRHCDRYLPFEVQRSCVSVVFHLERKGDYYFHSVLFMVFLVNIISLCTFSIPLDDVSGRLGHLSTCFLAVLAYRYVIDDTLPRKEYLTAADSYIIFACSFQVLICIQTVLLGFINDRMEMDSKTAMDIWVGVVLLLIWLGVNYYLRYLWKSSTRQGWQSVYQTNREPYAPILECSECGHRWLCKNCQVNDKIHKCESTHCDASGDSIAIKFLTPDDRPPVVKQQKFPSPPPELKELSKTTSPTGESSPSPSRLGFVNESFSPHKPLLLERINFTSSGYLR